MSRKMAVMRFLCVRDLRRGRAYMRRAACFRFTTGRLRFDSALAIEGVIRTFDFTDRRAVLVSIMHPVAVHVRDDCIMPEHASFPTSSGEAGTRVTIAVIDAAVKADLRSPIPCVPPVTASAKPQ